MNGNINSIDTDAGIGTILSHFDTNYINHVIDDCLQMRFRPFDAPMPNYVDILEREFVAIKANAKDYIDNINEVRSETYREIISKICNFYNLSCTISLENISEDELYGIAHTMYDIFVSRFTDHMLDFFVMYIINNADSITTYLKNDENAIKPKETSLYNPKYYIDPKYILIHANVNNVVYNMAAYDIEFPNLLVYLSDPNTAASLSSLFSDNGDIYKNYYASYILNPEYTAGVLTNIKLLLQQKTIEAGNIN